jgi:hypothetical protein
MYITHVLCNTVHYINEVYKCMYIYTPAEEATALTVFTGLDHQGMEECVGYTTYLHHILTLHLCKFGTKQQSHCTFCVTKHPVSW